MSSHAKVLAIRKEFTDYVQDSPYEALTVVKNQISWLGDVAEAKFTDCERKKILDACQQFYLAIRPLTEKYID